MNRRIFEFGYEGGYDIAEIVEGKIHFHTDMQSDFLNRFDNMNEWWAYYISINKWWMRFIHRHVISDELMPIVQQSLLDHKIVKHYQDVLDNYTWGEEGKKEFQGQLDDMVKRFGL